MPSRQWFDRVFTSGRDSVEFPEIVERLRGTPARIEDRVATLPDKVRTSHRDETWSIQENVGHLLDLEPLWEGRLDDLLADEAQLRPADLTNRRTHEARHDAADLAHLLRDFRTVRERIVARLDALDKADLTRVAHHPRLGTPMSVVDLFYFVAEHDDHHLVRITEIIHSSP